MKKLWNEYKKTRSIDDRNRIVEQFLPLVKKIASDVYQRLPNKSVEFEDLCSYGSIGLIEAVERYNPAINVKFQTYAMSRIRGSMLDHLRNIDWIPRSLRKKIKDYEKAVLEIKNEEGKEPTDEEIAKKLNLGIDDAKKIKNEVNRTQILSLEEYLFRNEKSRDEFANMRDTDSEDPSSVISKMELVEALKESIKKLKKREQLLLQLYYYEELNFKEIGAVLNISESRVSQIHSHILIKLKEELHKLLQ
jgi:RNA polymerase sigma factor for flagellar operon FliA